MSLAQQLADLEQTAPADFDPEDLNPADGAAFEDEGEDLPKTSGREHYVPVSSSTLRNKLQDIDDPKYAGQRVSRQELHEDDNSDAEEPGSFVDDEDESNGLYTGDESVDGGEETQSDSQEPGEERSSNNQAQSKQVGNAPANSRIDDLKKAKTVKRQGLLWNALVDARIRIQKAVVQANRLPNHAVLTDVLATSPVSQSLKRFLDSSLQLSEEMYNLQQSLMIVNEGLKPPAPKRRRLDVDGDFSDPQWTDIVAEATDERNTLESTLHPHLLQVLNKWSTRINAISSSNLLSSRTTAFRDRSSRTKEVAEILDDTLLDDKVLGRTRVLRNTLDRVGKKRSTNQQGVSGNRGTNDSEGEDWDIFDDTDFYHQLLRDVVDARKEGNGPDALPVRSQRVKKKVDTKASKGRKLRYTAHEKIQNFMVPIPRATWHEEQIDELFASLLGEAEKKDGTDGVRPNGDSASADAVLADGFKLFG